ncbi:DUF6776 family protein [Thiobacter aerophilum]|uniref:DUF6776 family protein n=1 Tax=Thiobacter aerophilum TaxID=3121275 RepID=A0ABV0EE37_9BURK
MASRLLRRLKSRFGIATARMRVRTHIPLPVRLIVVALLVGAGLALADWVYTTGLRLAGFEKSQAQEALRSLSDEVTRLERDNAALRAESARLRQQLEIEQATQRNLAQTLKGLQEENAILREDAAFFRNLLSPNPGAMGVTIYHAKLERNPLLPGEYRYRLLLLNAGPRDQEFSGSVELLVSGVRDGRTLTVAEPGAKGRLPVRFRYYQRLEGSLQLPEGMSPRSLQVRVFEAGAVQPRWTRTLALP